MNYVRQVDLLLVLGMISARLGCHVGRLFDDKIGEVEMSMRFQSQEVGCSSKAKVAERSVCVVCVRKENCWRADTRSPFI